MSRHHMLPPIIYTPPPKPRKIESRKRRIQLRSTGIVRNADEIDETEETSALQPPVTVAYRPPTDTDAPIEGSERKPKSTTGLLDEGTLKVMLLAQEQAK